MLSIVICSFNKQFWSTNLGKEVWPWMRRLALGKPAGVGGHGSQHKACHYFSATHYKLEKHLHMPLFHSNLMTWFEVNVGKFIFQKKRKQALRWEDMLKAPQLVAVRVKKNCLQLGQMLLTRSKGLHGQKVSIWGHLFSLFSLPSPFLLTPLPSLLLFSPSVALCDPEDWSMPGFPVYHQLLELAQTRVHWFSDAIQPSHPLLSPSPTVLNLSQYRGLFQWVSSSHQVSKVLELQQVLPWLTSFRIGWFDLLAIQGTLKSRL